MLDETTTIGASLDEERDGASLSEVGGIPISSIGTRDTTSSTTVLSRVDAPSPQLSTFRLLTAHIGCDIPIPRVVPFFADTN